MRKIVFQMMTTMNGRLDDPFAWMNSVGDDQYRDIERNYATFDTVLVGRTTYEEMAAYWPGALSETDGSATNQAMARRMSSYRKLVFSKSGRQKLTEWNNVEQVVVDSDDELANYISNLKTQPGGDIHLAGGASFAQSVIGLGLVDEFRFFIYPLVSPGASWFSRLADRFDLQLLGAKSYENGVVGLNYVPLKRAVAAKPASFSELLT